MSINGICCGIDWYGVFFVIFSMIFFLPHIHPCLTYLSVKFAQCSLMCVYKIYFCSNGSWLCCSLWMVLIFAGVLCVLLLWLLLFLLLGIYMQLRFFCLLLLNLQSFYAIFSLKCDYNFFLNSSTFLLFFLWVLGFHYISLIVMLILFRAHTCATHSNALRHFTRLSSRWRILPISLPFIVLICKRQSIRWPCSYKAHAITNSLSHAKHKASKRTIYSSFAYTYLNRD